MGSGAVVFVYIYGKAPPVGGLFFGGDADVGHAFCILPLLCDSFFRDL